MQHKTLITLSVAMFASGIAGTSLSQTQTPPPAQSAPPPFATTKVEGTDNVYIFRYQGHQSMFVVTSDGVIATDPIGLGRPQAVTTYIDEIKKVTSQPIKYVIYSHNHYDHITGGKPFKDLGARFIAHKNAKAQLERLQPPNIVMPDEVVDNQRRLRSATRRSSCSTWGATILITRLSCDSRRRRSFLRSTSSRSRPCSGAACRTAGSMSGRPH